VVEVKRFFKAGKPFFQAAGAQQMSVKEAPAPLQLLVIHRQGAKFGGR